MGSHLRPGPASELLVFRCQGPDLRRTSCSAPWSVGTSGPGLLLGVLACDQEIGTFRGHSQCDRAGGYPGRRGHQNDSSSAAGPWCPDHRSSGRGGGKFVATVTDLTATSSGSSSPPDLDGRACPNAEFASGIRSIGSSTTSTHGWRQPTAVESPIWCRCPSFGTASPAGGHTVVEPTGRNSAGHRQVRLGVGPTRDVVLVEVRCTRWRPARSLTRSATPSRPRPASTHADSPAPTLLPHHPQRLAWREADELEDKDLVVGAGSSLKSRCRD